MTLMNTEEKFQLIKRNTAEILGEEELKKLIDQKKKNVYLGTSITGSPHIGYFVWSLKLADFAKAGFKVKILLADLHGALDNTPWKELEERYKYYKKIIPLLFEPFGVKKTSLEFVKGSDFQLTKQYALDLLKLSTFVSVHDATKSASEVVKMGDNPKLSGLLYPLMQALDEEYLQVDVQYGGIDQRKIFVLAAENLSRLGYKKRVHVMTPLVPGLVGAKMSSSISGSKIDLLDTAEVVEKKIREAICEAGNPENGVLGFLKQVIFPLKEDSKEQLVIVRPEKFGGSVKYSTYRELEADFVAKKLHPLDVKNSLTKEINSLLAPIRKKEKELKKLYLEAYTN